MRVMSRQSRFLLVVSLLAAASPVLPGQYGLATWTKVSLTAQTHLGALQVDIATKGGRTDLRLGGIELRIEGKRVAIPRRAPVEIPAPRLHELRVIHTAPIACIGETCPDVHGLPVSIVLPFGDHVEGAGVEDGRRGDVCHFSELELEFTRDAVERVSIRTCRAKTGDYEERRIFPGDGLEHVDR
jgi:hypothetical protein